jgi:hypothetical protein
MVGIFVKLLNPDEDSFSIMS